MSEIDDAMAKMPVGAILHAPVNTFNTMFEEIKIADSNHPAYHYIQVWLKIGAGVWYLVSTVHKSEI